MKMFFPSQINWFLCNHLNEPLKASRRPTVSRSFSVEDVRTSEQHHPDARSSFSNFDMEFDFSRHYLRSFYKTSRHGNTSKCYPTFHNIPGFLYGREFSLYVSSHSKVFSLTSLILLSFGPFENIGIIVIWDVDLRYCAWLFYLCTGCILIYLCLLDCSIFAFICASNWQSSLYHIIFELTGSNIFLWIKENHWYFCLILLGICHFASSSIVLNNGLFGKLTIVEVICSKFQRSQISDKLIPPAHTESSVTYSSRFAPARDSVVNLLYHLADHLFRGFHSTNDWFRARRLKWLKVYGFPASRASRSGSNLEDMISWGCGFLLWWFKLLMRHFTIILVVLNLIIVAFLYYSVYPLSFCDKNGEYFLFWTSNVFPNRSSVFCPRMAKKGVC